jgi:hypothetical protein
MENITSDNDFGFLGSKMGDYSDNIKKKLNNWEVHSQPYAYFPPKKFQEYSFSLIFRNSDDEVKSESISFMEYYKQSKNQKDPNFDTISTENLINTGSVQSNYSYNAEILSPSPQSH